MIEMKIHKATLMSGHAMNSGRKLQGVKFYCAFRSKHWMIAGA